MTLSPPRVERQQLLKNILRSWGHWGELVRKGDQWFVRSRGADGIIGTEDDLRVAIDNRPKGKPAP